MYKRHLLEIESEKLNENSSSNALWERIEQDYKKSKLDNSNKTKIVDKDLKVIRIFISSTFKDFYNERDVLIKTVFPKLRKWCEEQGLFLVECDLRWGVPVDSTNFEAVSYCLEEIEKSRLETNNNNFFLCLIGNRFGWVPSEEELVGKLKMKYDYIENSSVTLMEIVHGVLRSCTGNCLFMIRSEEILKDIPANYLQFFEEKDSDIKHNVEEQQKFIKKHFSIGNCVKEYNIKFDSIIRDPISGKERLLFKEFNEFSDVIENYFKEKISEFKTKYQLTPASDDQNEDMIHKSYLIAINKNSFKRESDIQSLNEKIKNAEASNKSHNPLIILTGEAGSGKSTIMGNLIEYFLNQVDINVFYHFCGASNLSHTVSNIYERLKNYLETTFSVSVVDENQENNERTLSDNIDEKEIKLKQLFTRPEIPKMIIIIDAVDELWDVKITETFPLLTGKNILLIISCLHDENPDSNYSKLINKESTNEVIPLGKMTKVQLINIINLYLNNFGKRLDSSQLEKLMSFESSSNPLWLLSACEELRNHGDYSSLTKFISNLPASIANLNRMIIKRLIEEDKSNIIKTLLQLLVVSRAGLWESLVKDILASILGHSQTISHSAWSNVVWQLKGFLQIQSIPLPLIKLRHRVMKESIEDELSMEEEFRINLHLKMSSFLKELLDSEREMFTSDYLFHTVKSDSRNSLIDFMRSKKSWSVLRQKFIRGKIMSSMRCTNFKNNMPGQSAQELKMCIFCANKLGNLSIYSVNKNCCFFCGDVVMSNTINDTKLYPCHFHSQSPKCALCSNVLFSAQSESLKICHLCITQCPPNRCGVIVREQDILFRQQLNFSKSVYKIETLI